MYQNKLLYFCILKILKNTFTREHEISSQTIHQLAYLIYPFTITLTKLIKLFESNSFSLPESDICNQLKAQICRIFQLKYPKTTRTMLYILLTCVLTLSQMFLRMFKSREISNFNQDTERVRVSPINDIITLDFRFYFVETIETSKTL